MKIHKHNIEQFIPQRQPFIMVDNLIEATATRFVSDFKISSDNIFLENNVFREFGLIENLVQTCGAGLMLIKRDAGEQLKDGFTGALSNINVAELPPVNSTLLTIVTLLNEFANMYLLQGEVYVEQKKIVECRMKLVGI